MKFSSAIIIYSFLFFSLFSGLFIKCARFRIQELEPVRVARIKLSSIQSTVVKSYTGQTPFTHKINYNQLSLRPVVMGSDIYLANPAAKAVRVYSTGSGNLVKIIGEINIKNRDNIDVIPIQNSIPGWIASDGNKNIFIQFRAAAEKKEKVVREKKKEIILPEQRLPGIFNTGDRDITPSLIYQINENNQIVRIIGTDGLSGTGFGLIYRMDASPDGLLFVCHRQGEKKVLSIFREGSLVSIFESFPPVTEEEKKKYIIETEALAPNPDGKFIIASAIFRDKKTRQPIFRKVYRWNEPDAEPVEVYTTDTYNDYFAWSRPDGGFYLMNTEEDGSQILFKIFAKNGEYLNNRLIRFPGILTTWRETYITIDGRVFTSRFIQGNFDVYEWQ